MTETEALMRVKTGNFGGDYGFDMQLLVDAVGIIGEMFKSGQISEVVRCKDCKHGSPNGEYGCTVYHYKKYEIHNMKPDDFCSGAERRDNG